MKLILFDIDGTLIRSAGVGRTAMARAIEEVAGIPTPLARVSLGGKTDPLILEEAFAQAGRTLDGAAPSIFERYLVLLEAGLRVATQFQVLPGVLELVRQLAATDGIGLALGTGNIEPGARLKLGHAALNHYFPTGGFGSDASDRTELLLAGVAKAERHYGTSFTETWVVGDTPLDIHAARSAGLRIAAVATGGYPVVGLAEHEPDGVFDSFSDVGEALRLFLNDD